MNHSISSMDHSRWMLVDDNADVLALMAALAASVTDAELECHTAPAAALAAFRSAPEKYAVVITDFEMPGLDGVALCRQLRAIAPALKVLLATGSGFFTEAAARHAGFSGLLTKPFPLETLRATLAAAGIETNALAVA